MTKRLTRSETNKMIAGVCGGMAEYFDLDPVLVRLVWVILGLTTGVGFIAYIVCWIVMPTKSAVAAGQDNDAVVAENVADLKATAKKTAEEIKKVVEKK